MLSANTAPLKPSAVTRAMMMRFMVVLLSVEK
jgi:hypothetical protein